MVAAAPVSAPARPAAGSGKGNLLCAPRHGGGGGRDDRGRGESRSGGSRREGVSGRWAPACPGRPSWFARGPVGPEGAAAPEPGGGLPGAHNGPGEGGHEAAGRSREPRRPGGVRGGRAGKVSPGGES